MVLSNMQQKVVTVPAQRAATALIGLMGLVMTLAKPLWAIPIIWLMADSAFLTGVVIVTFIVWDHFDGVLFRRSRLVADRWLGCFRRVIDVFGDRFVIHSTCIAAIYKVAFPLELYLVILGRELILLAIVSVVTFKASQVIEPNWWSRSATLCIGLAALSWLGDKPQWCVASLIMMWLCSVMGFWRYYQTLYQPKRLL